MHLLANVFESGVAKKRAGQKARFAQDLKSVADAEHGPAFGSELFDGLHDGRKVGDGPGAQVVSVGEAPGNQNGIAALEVGGIVPETGNRLVGDFCYDVVSIVVAVGAGEDEDAELHTSRLPQIAAWAREIRGAHLTGLSRRAKLGAGTPMAEWKSHVRTAGGALLNWWKAVSIEAVCVAFLWWIGLVLIHVPLAPVWALIGGVMTFIPNFGGAITVIFPVLAVLFSGHDYF